MNNHHLFLGIVLLGLLGAGSASASSHREAPVISKDPLADNTDVYAFVSTETGKTDRVVLISNWIPLQIAPSGPNFWGFDDSAIYDIRIDNDGDALEDITYQFRFTSTRVTGDTFLYNTNVVNSVTDTALNIKQTYSVTIVKAGVSTVVASGLPVAPCNTGSKSFPNYATIRNQCIQTLPDGSRVFCGQRSEQFYLDLGGIFDLLNVNPASPVNGTAGLNVHSIALEIPMNLVTKNQTLPTDPANTNSIIGLWSTTLRRQVDIHRKSGVISSRGPFVQVSRLGNPLVNELVIGLKDKDKYNASHPRDDAQFLSYVTNSILAATFTAVFGPTVAPTPPTPRNDLVAVFLTGIEGLNKPANVRPAEMMRLNLAIPPSATINNLGVIAGDNRGYPNGRRVADDVVDISLRVVGGILGTQNTFNTTVSDGVNQPDVPFLTGFPWLADPHPGR